MKRYLAFKGAVYYPSSGMGDLYGDFDTEAEAIEAIVTSGEDAHLWEYWKDGLDYATVWDSETRTVVWDEEYLEDQE